MLNAIRAAPVCGRVPLFVPLCVVFNGMGELGVCGVLSCVSPVGAWFRRTVPQRTGALSGGGRVGGSRVPRSCTREGLTRRVVASTRCTACRRSRMRASGSTPRMPSTASSKSRSRCSRKLLAFRERGGWGEIAPVTGEVTRKLPTCRWMIPIGVAERDDRDSQDSWDNACAVPVVVEVSVVLDWRREYENRRKCAYELWYNSVDGKD